MNILIAGTGKVGLTLARQLASEGHDITLIDQNTLVLPKMCFCRPVLKMPTW